MQKSDLTVLNLGAGVQSSTLLLMACAGELPRPDVAIFADPGWESKATYAWLGRLETEAEAVGIPLDRVSGGNIRDDVLAAIDGNGCGHIGQPPFYVINQGTDHKGGRLWRKCTRDYKIDPIHRRVRERLGLNKGQRIPKNTKVEQWIGISRDEVVRMKPAREPWIETKWPLIDAEMTRWDCHRWLKAHSYPVVPKSSCLCCPFHDAAYWREIRDESPVEWANVVEFDHALRRGTLPGVTGQAFLHRSLRPLDEVDLNTDHPGQLALDLWGGECEGICGT